MKRRKIWCSKMICMSSMLVLVLAFLCGCDATSRRLELSSKPGREVSEGTSCTEEEGPEEEWASGEMTVDDMSETGGLSEKASETTANAVSEIAGGPSSTCYVHVCGQVRQPGLYELPAGKRIGDAIDMAGGLLKDADPVAVNLAAVLEDGMQIYVPSTKEREEGNRPSSGIVAGAQTGDSLSASQASKGASSVGGASAVSGRVNINTASLEELMSLSGIGESKAGAIIQYREEHGTFSSAEEITSVSGIGDGTYKKIKDSITVQ